MSDKLKCKPIDLGEFEEVKSIIFVKNDSFKKYNDELQQSKKESIDAILTKLSKHEPIRGTRHNTISVHNIKEVKKDQHRFFYKDFYSEKFDTTICLFFEYGQKGSLNDSKLESIGKRGKTYEKKFKEDYG